MSPVRLKLLVLAIILMSLPAGAPVTSAAEAQSNPDVDDYAAAYGISKEAAAQQFGYQTDAGELQAELMTIGADWFGGMWIRRDPQYEVVVASVDLDAPGLKAAVDDSPARGVVRFVKVTRSLAELRAAADELRSKANGSYRVQVDLPGNGLTVWSRSVTETSRFITDQGLTLPEFAAMKEDRRHAVPVVDIIGGLRLYRQSNGSYACTSGFTVRDGLLNKYTTTAAHCTNALMLAAPTVTLTWVSAAWYGAHDEQLHSFPAGHTGRNRIHDGITPIRTITSKIHRTNQVIGATYCKYGRTTFYDCGELIDNEAWCSSSNPSALCMHLHRAGVDLAGPGDSGGPVFVGGAAVGMISLCLSDDLECDDNFLDDDMVYVAENYIESGLNVTILTQ